MQPKNVRLEVLESVALFLPHKNTDILLEHHRGTITKSGLPVFPLQLKCMEAIKVANNHQTMMQSQ